MIWASFDSRVSDDVDLADVVAPPGVMDLAGRDVLSEHLARRLDEVQARRAAFFSAPHMFDLRRL